MSLNPNIFDKDNPCEVCDGRWRYKRSGKCLNCVLKRKNAAMAEKNRQRNAERLQANLSMPRPVPASERARLMSMLRYEDV